MGCMLDTLSVTDSGRLMGRGMLVVCDRGLGWGDGDLFVTEMKDVCKIICSTPKARLRMSGISVLSFDFPFLSPLIFLLRLLALSVSSFSANGPFSLTPPQKTYIFH